MRALAPCLMVLWCWIAAWADTPEEIQAAQKDAAEKLWQFVLTKGAKTPSLASPSFFFIGTVDGKQLEPLSKAAEKVLPSIKKTLEISEKDQPWEGYIVVHVCKQSREFRSLYFKLKKERAHGDEMGFYVHEGKNTQIVLSPALQSKGKLTVELELISQLGSALISRKRADGNLPIWLVLGYGRAVAMRYAPKAFALERQQAALLVGQGKNMYELQGDSMNPFEWLVLSGSLADFMAHGVPLEKYWSPFLQNITTDRDFYGALREIKLDPDLLQKSWAQWVKNPR
jgi:hypothetical protein